MTDRPAFAFRLHQFISRGDTVYASLEPEDERYITVTGQKYVPDDRSRVLMPLAFCRECGQEYYPVRAFPDETATYLEFYPRTLSDIHDDGESESGFLFHSSTEPWPSEPPRRSRSLRQGRSRGPPHLPLRPRDGGGPPPRPARQRRLRGRLLRLPHDLHEPDGSPHPRPPEHP